MRVITVEHLTKIYHLYASPTARLKEALHPFRRKYHHDFYALKNVSFEVNQGEVLGIIGKNGCGKSTLLKIVAGVLTPTSGNVSVNGKVSALLELGAGFNPEFTGLENVYFSTTIMGYTRTQVEHHLDAILAFADIGEFVYQPVKTYSSGMYVRLAFAVAINVAPEILILDEVLAVGDIRFQQKCFRKIKEFQERGKSIMFVTHDTGAVINFCNRVIWIDSGKILHEGAPEQIVKRYVTYMAYGLATEEPKNSATAKDARPSEHQEHGVLNVDALQWQDVSMCSSFGEGGARIVGVALYAQQPFERLTTFEGGKPIRFFVKLEIQEHLFSPGLGTLLNDQYGNAVFGINNYIYEIDFGEFLEEETIVVEYDFLFPDLKNGQYAFQIAISEGTQQTHIIHHWIYDAYVIQIAKNHIKNQLGFFFIVDDVKFHCFRS